MKTSKKNVVDSTESYSTGILKMFLTQAALLGVSA
jgi:hypothetical protein